MGRLLTHADTGVSDRNVHSFLFDIVRNKDIDGTFRGVLEGVVDQVVNDLKGLSDVGVNDTLTGDTAPEKQYEI